MRKVLYVAILSTGYFVTYADTTIYYDSQGFENPTSFNVGGYPYTSSDDFSTLYPSTPQPFNLFGGSTVETLFFNNGGGGGAYDNSAIPTSDYALGLIGSPVGTPVYNAAGTSVIQVNYDSFSLPIDTTSCSAVESVTIEFDLSLAVLYGSALTNPIRPYFPNTMYGTSVNGSGTPVPPMVDVKLFDEQNIDINFNTELASQIETGTRSDALRQAPFLMEWTSHSVTLPLTQADLIGTTALVNISGAGSDAPNENTYVALDNIMVSLNTPTGVACEPIASVGDPQAIPSTNTNTLLVLLLSLLSVVGYGVYRKVKVK